MKYHLHPIAALATARGISAVAMIRLSGNKCHQLLYPLLDFYSQIEQITDKTRYMLRVRIRDPHTQQVYDDGMIVFFQSPHSYTGEDAAELYIHGGPYIADSCLKLLYTHGFQPALPGEFTQRAFIHGKMNLITAEGIRELTHAESRAQWLLGQNLMSGKLKQYVDHIREQLIAARVQLEAAMDFPDEPDTQHISHSQLILHMQHVQSSLNKLYESYHSGRIAKDGFRVVFIGKPNAGKSTLMNVLCKHQRSIVTDEKGTTRDYIEESVMLRGRKFCFIDTAGIRPDSEVTSEAERTAIQSTWKQLENADLIYYMVCVQDVEVIDWQSMYKLHSTHSLSTPSLRLITQCDLTETKPTWIKPQDICIAAGGADSTMRTNTINTLTDDLCSRIDHHITTIEHEAFICTQRQQYAIQQACRCVEEFFQEYHAKAYDEVLASYLQNIGHYLADIIGEIASDDILDGVFRDFCLGK